MWHSRILRVNISKRRYSSFILQTGATGHFISSRVIMFGGYVISGPAFWNIVVDEILSVHWPQGVHIQAFADDFAFIVSDNNREGLRKLSKFAMDKFKDWADKNKLQVSMEKSSYVLFRKLVRGPMIKWGNQPIASKTI
ncbi:hypothetical protein AVEN_221487-1 [Araneus ventricosus]|uniref:Reverse transcriptase domain-containing protein n=1 Tax=Araneus ventricosus TaxID=182803 RepID=A0A4Y2E3K3_ARAVE|nr:hypothetical protein AVEN_221487-1 [Araneus ventricosus]